MTFYPVIIPTLNRSKHFKACIDSLLKCKYADQTDLIIGLDYPPSYEYESGYLENKNYIKTIVGFKSVKVIEREYNYGARRNLKALVDEVKVSYDAFILSEDDNIFSPAFLEFMNTALNNFNDCDNITSICGYILPQQYNPQVNYLLTHDNSAWGIGYWSSKIKFFEEDYGKKVLNSIIKSWKVFRTYPQGFLMLMLMYQNNKVYGDTNRTVFNIINNTFQLRPSISLVRNMGHDGSGVNCDSNDQGFNNQSIYSGYSYEITKQSQGKYLPAFKLFIQGYPKFGLRSCLSIIKIWFRYLFYKVRGKYI